MTQLSINILDLLVSAASSVLQACVSAGIPIPHFCYHKDLSVAGAFLLIVLLLKGNIVLLVYILLAINLTSTFYIIYCHRQFIYNLVILLFAFLIKYIENKKSLLIAAPLLTEADCRNRLFTGLAREWLVNDSSISGLCCNYQVPPLWEPLRAFKLIVLGGAQHIEAPHYFVHHPGFEYTIYTQPFISSPTPISPILYGIGVKTVAWIAPTIMVPVAVRKREALASWLADLFSQENLVLMGSFIGIGLCMYVTAALVGELHAYYSYRQRIQQQLPKGPNSPKGPDSPKGSDTPKGTEDFGIPQVKEEIELLDLTKEILSDPVLEGSGSGGAASSASSVLPPISDFVPEGFGPGGAASSASSVLPPVSDSVPEGFVGPGIPQHTTYWNLKYFRIFTDRFEKPRPVTKVHSTNELKEIVIDVNEIAHLQDIIYTNLNALFRISKMPPAEQRANVAIRVLHSLEQDGINVIGFQVTPTLLRRVTQKTLKVLDCFQSHLPTMKEEVEMHMAFQNAITSDFFQLFLFH